jgi:hypothetical protein
MAKKLPTGERPKQLSKTAKTIKKAAASPSRASGLKAEKITPREAARRAGVERDRMNRKTNTAVFNSKTSTVYSPKPMSAAAKKKAAAAGKKTESKTLLRTIKPINEKGSRGPKVGSSTVSKVVKRAKSVAREVRDVPTALANTASVTYSRMGNAPLKVPGKALAKDLAKQVGEAARAVATGKKGTTPLKTYNDYKNQDKRWYSSSKKNREQMDVPKGIKPGKKRK